MLANAEAKFPPKMVYTSSDWLKTQREDGQDLKRYAQGGPNISWHNPRMASTIYLFIVDDTIPAELAERFKRYTEAFYSGIPVKLLRAGDKMKETQRNGKTVVKATIPANFLEHHQVQARDNMGMY